MNPKKVEVKNMFWKGALHLWTHPITMHFIYMCVANGKYVMCAKNGKCVIYVYACVFYIYNKQSDSQVINEFEKKFRVQNRLWECVLHLWIHSIK